MLASRTEPTGWPLERSRSSRLISNVAIRARPVVDENRHCLARFGGYDGMGDNHCLAEVLRLGLALIDGEPTDPLNHGCQFGCCVVAENLDPAGREFAPYRGGRPEAGVLDRLAEYLVLDGLRRPERAEDRDQQPLLVGGQEVQARAGVYDRTRTNPGSSVAGTSVARRSRSSASRST